MKESIPYGWRRIPERYRLEGSVCETCGRKFFPPREICPVCRSKGKIKPFTFSGKGTVYSFTEIYSPPAGFEGQTPYVMAIIELEEGARCTAQVVETTAKDIKIGDRVEAVFRKIQSDDPEGVIHYGFKFRKIE